MVVPGARPGLARKRATSSRVDAIKSRPSGRKSTPENIRVEPTTKTLAQCFVARLSQNAVRVMDDDDLKGTENLLRIKYRPNGIVRSTPTGILHGVCISERKPQHAKWINTGLHTGEDHNACDHLLAS
jgi:hypothetical protein